MRHALVVVVVLAACKSDKNENPTKPGTVVLDWDVSKTDNAELAQAKLGEVKSYDLDFETRLVDDKKTPVKLKIHLETATVSLKGHDGNPTAFQAPSKLVVTAVDAGDFTLGPPLKGCRGPNFQLDLPYPRNMILQCYLHANRPRHELAISLTVLGDGTVMNELESKP